MAVMLQNACGESMAEKGCGTVLVNLLRNKAEKTNATERHPFRGVRDRTSDNLTRHIGHNEYHGSGGAGLSVPRSRLKTEFGSHEGIESASATRSPIARPTTAIVLGPSQFHSGRTVSEGW